MTDIWPWGGPKYTTYDDCVANLRTQGMDAANAKIGAAIAWLESSGDYLVVNDTPATGDYSVGIWQINYYQGLYASRVAMFGTPKQLALGGVSAQAHACYTLWIDNGWNPWPEWAEGTYVPYLNGWPARTGPEGGGEPTIEQGSTGAAVTALQRDLNILGYKLTVDGDFGPATRSAVITFQRRHSLSQDGIVGPLTWAAIDSAVSAAQGASPSEGTSSAPAPPNEASPTIDSTVQGAWSQLRYAAGPYANSYLQAFQDASDALLKG